MKILLTEEEVLELAFDRLDLANPDPDKIQNIALRMDMQFIEEMGMWHDVEEYSFREASTERDNLKSINKDILEALENVYNLLSNSGRIDYYSSNHVKEMESAIAKAKL